MIKILVVEDDVQLNQMVCIYLNDSGFEAKGCLNAIDAYDEMYNNMYQKSGTGCRRHECLGGR